MQKIYVTLFPCNECAKLIIQSGITEIIYYAGKVNSISSTTNENDATESDNNSDNNNKENDINTDKGEMTYFASKKLLDLANIPTRQFSYTRNIHLKLPPEEY